MNDSDNGQVQIDTPPEEETESTQETLTEEAEEERVIPTVLAKAQRQPKEQHEPKMKSEEIVVSLEATEYFDDQTRLTPETSLIEEK